MNLSSTLKLNWLGRTGKVFSEAISSLGPEAANSFNRWSKAWRLILKGEDTPEVRALLEKESLKLREYLELLPEEERYEAAMAVHTRVPRSIEINEALIKLAKTTSILLDPAREKLVAFLASSFHKEVNQLLKRAAAGEKLMQRETEVLPHLLNLKTMTGAEYDDFITELARESIYQLKASAGAEIKKVASKLNSMQGAVAQIGFFKTKQFRSLLETKLKQLRDLTRQSLGTGWTTAAVTEGRIFIARKTKSGYTLNEYVDGAIVSYEKAASGRLNKSFLGFSAQVKAEQRVTALPQNLNDELRRTPEWGSYDAILFIPSGKTYKPLQLVPPPTSITQERLLMAAEGGTWPTDIKVPPSVAKTIKVEGPMTRNGCRSLGGYFLSKSRAALK